MRDLNLNDNTAQVACFRFKNRPTAPLLVVGNIHVLFNPKRGDIKLGQVRTCNSNSSSDACNCSRTFYSVRRAAGKQVRWLQVRTLLEAVHRVGCTAAAASGMHGSVALACGDFNSSHHSPLYKYASKCLHNCIASSNTLHACYSRIKQSHSKCAVQILSGREPGSAGPPQV